MCGIFGHVGKKDSLKTCLDGIKLLEYRGYDSAGIAGFDEETLFVCKEPGKVVHLEKKIQKEKKVFSLKGAIIHTRWATHGEPSLKNAHPHQDEKKQIALIHNGIIENHSELREFLEKKHVVFSSDTDTEVIAQLISFHYKNDLLEAVQKTATLLKGSFSIACIHRNHPSEIVATAKESPLAIGYPDDKEDLFLSSDPNAFLGQDLNVIYLQDGEIVSLKPFFLGVFDSQLKNIQKEVFLFEGKECAPTKGPFEHFMLKEIFEQPATIEKIILGQNFEHFGMPSFLPTLQEVDQIIIVACGTSWHAGCFAAALMEEKLGILVQSEIASEWRFKKKNFSKKTLVIAVSQSGETADTLAAVRNAKIHGAKVLGLCNVPRSSLARESDHCIFLQAGPELSVCSTKAFTAQITHFFLLTLFLGRFLGKIEKDEEMVLLQGLKQIPKQIQTILSQKEQIWKLAKKYQKYSDFFFLGRLWMVPTAMEAALKFKEISYLNAMAYPAGELKHGPIALLHPEYPVVAFCAGEKTQEKMMSNLMEVKARKAPLFSIAPEGMEKVKEISDDLFLVPKTRDELAIFPSTIVGQLFAYYVAREKGTEIDQPRNLAKSVTVE